jgi:hypothetical protein
MKSIIQKLALAALLLAGTVAASAKNTTAPAPSAEQQAAKLKEKWTKVLNSQTMDNAFAPLTKLLLPDNVNDNTLQ